MSTHKEYNIKPSVVEAEVKLSQDTGDDYSVYSKR